LEATGKPFLKSLRNELSGNSSRKVHSSEPPSEEV
jgi:hypothetical protein